MFCDVIYCLHKPFIPELLDMISTSGGVSTNKERLNPMYFVAVTASWIQEEHLTLMNSPDSSAGRAQDCNCPVLQGTCYLEVPGSIPGQGIIFFLKKKIFYLGCF
ncbi:hypothetical protein ACN38_g11143 [Penicillium nordicum]|uniref:Uncharacterized protein n=1 Tax=Penicillium nordicum TaxID=229535 RepID=A0A0M9WB32_9EURO|nr:hypothetical protein ACN38_g11143 [Penicillium nordicum]